MAYVGTPIDTRNTFQSLQGKRFNGDGSTTAFTLDVAPSSTLDIEVFVGNVRQDPNSAYTLSGTTLTFTGAPPSGTNNIYVVHQAKSVGTIDVPSGGVQSGSLASAFLTGQTDIGAGIADADLFLVDDGAGGTLRKTAASRLKTYIGSNTPAFYVQKTSDQTVSDNAKTLVTFDDEVYDTDSAFASNKFTVPSGGAGKYNFYIHVSLSTTGSFGVRNPRAYIYKNGSSLYMFSGPNNEQGNDTYSVTGTLSLDLSASDYIEVYGRNDNDQGNPLFLGKSGDSPNEQRSWFGGYKVIT
jgi:hypothetical protein